MLSEKKTAVQKINATLWLYFILITVQGQAPKKVTAGLFFQYTKTIYDQAKGNNPWGIGSGLQLWYNNPTKFKPAIELTGDLYLEDDKVAIIGADGKILDDVRGMVNLFFGSSFHPIENIYLSLTAGPSFIGGQTLFGIKPAVGFYFSGKHRSSCRISYINIFDRNKPRKKDFGSLSFAFGLKLF